MSAAVDWHRVREAALARADALATLPLGEITPSRRDFTQFLGSGRQATGVVATLRRRDPASGSRWPDADAAALATALDDTEIAALAVTTEGLYHEGCLEDLRAVSEAAGAPLLRDEPLLHPLQVYESRMHGADACIVALAWVSDGVLAEMIRVARSLHMAAVLAVESEADAARACAHERVLVGLRAGDGGGGLDRARLERLAAAVDRRRSVLLLDDAAPAHWADLRGHVDAALVARAVLDTADPAAAVEALL